MQITADEAATIAASLPREQIPFWVDACRTAVQRFGLDRPPIGDGRRTWSRRRYTCPFYLGDGEPGRGCAVSRDVKPLGCLAFNPRRAGLTAGGDCGTPEDFVVPANPAEGDGAGRLPIPVALLQFLAPSQAPCAGGI
jgi:hypothetical protein